MTKTRGRPFTKDYWQRKKTLSLSVETKNLQKYGFNPTQAEIDIMLENERNKKKHLNANFYSQEANALAKLKQELQTLLN